MKKIIFLVSLFLINMATAQQVLIQDFTTASSYTFAGFEGLASAAIVSDPVPGGTRGNGLQLVNQTSGNPWQGAEVVLTTKKMKLTTDKTVKVDVYSTQAFTLLAKVEMGGPASATSANYTTPGAWQTLTFTFTNGLDGTVPANGEYQKIVFFGNWKADNTGFNTPANFTFHVDNITAEEAVIVPEPMPTTAAPTPPQRPAADVKSIFSDAYPPIAVLNYAGVDGQPSNDNTFNTSWCPATTTLIQVAGNNTNKITGLGCEGVSFLAGRFDATTFTHFHMDIWTPTATMDKSFNIKFSNWNGGSGEANAIEYSVNNGNLLPSTNPGTWISLDIPLANFTPINGANRNDLVQFIISSNLGTVYYDNLYLHKNTLGTNESNAGKNLRIYPNPVTSGETVFADAKVKNMEILTMAGQKVKTSASQSISSQGLSKGVYVLKVTNDKGETQSSILIVK